MARRVQLHIGLPKTGTTFLQTTMWHNRPLLRKQGVLYPGQRRLDHYNAFQQVRRGGSEGAWDALVSALARWSKTGLVSHEFFSMCTPTQAERVVADLAPAQVDVFVTVRSYVRQFPAVWQEALKMQVDASFDDFMEDAFAERLSGAWGWASQDVAAVLERWSTAVPGDRIHLVTVPPPGGPRDLLWRRWCTALDIDDSGFALDVHYTNESIGAPQAALLRRVKPHLSGPLRKGPEQHRWVRRYFGHEVLVPQGGVRFEPRPEHVARLHERAKEAIRAIERGGYSVTGDLDDLLDAGPPAPGPHPDDVTAEEMLDVAARSIEQMIRDMRAMTHARDRWRARARSNVAGRVRSRLRSLAGRARNRWPG